MKWYHIKIQGNLVSGIHNQYTSQQVENKSSFSLFLEPQKTLLPIENISLCCFNICKSNFWILESERSKNEDSNNIMVFFISVKTIHLVLITYKIIIKNIIKTSNIEKKTNEELIYIYKYEHSNCLDKQIE